MYDTGLVKQHEETVGTVALNDDGTTVTIRVDQPTYLRQSLVIDIPELPVGTSASVRFASVQGIAGMSWSQQSNSRIVLQFPPLQAEAHTSVLIGLPPRMFHPGVGIQFRSAVQRYPLYGAAIFISTLVSLLLAFYIQLRPSSVKSIPGEEQELHAWEMGVLLHGGLFSEDVSALFLSMAQRKQFDIVQGRQEIMLLRRGQNEPGTPEELVFLQVLFADGRRITHLNEEVSMMRTKLFSPLVASLYEAAYSRLIQFGYYLEHPQRSHLRVKTVGVVLQLVGTFSAVWVFLSPPSAGFLLFLTCAFLQYGAGLFLYSVSTRIALLSKKGRSAREYVISFIHFLALPEPLLGTNVRELFYQYLPHAVALGVTGVWYRRCQGGAGRLPDWLIVNGENLEGEQFAVRAISIAQQLSQTLRQLKDPNVG